MSKRLVSDALLDLFGLSDPDLVSFSLEAVRAENDTYKLAQLLSSTFERPASDLIPLAEKLKQIENKNKQAQIQKNVQAEKKEGKETKIEEKNEKKGGKRRAEFTQEDEAVEQAKDVQLSDVMKRKQTDRKAIRQTRAEIGDEEMEVEEPPPLEEIDEEAKKEEERLNDQREKDAFQERLKARDEASTKKVNIIFRILLYYRLLVIKLRKMKGQKQKT